ncbi:Glycosyl hydrolase family protein [Hibiscus syriacus]|uniref:Glycosyl hydrolase family protein n=1 Tax=Hibiscus syriacus TaxID=106335 RepID=A0A6A2Z2Z4_HIBSY|nr:Glycosyl hydrolase family protein [Hibiscus syriacus]
MTTANSVDGNPDAAMPGLVFFNDFSLYSLAILIADQVARSISEAAPRHYILKIMSFSFLRKTGIDKYESGEFDAGGYKWKLVLYPHGNKSRNVKEHLSLYLVSADVASRIDLDLEVHAVFRFFLLDQTKDNYLTVHDATGKDWRFHRSKHQWGFDQLIPIRTFNDAGNGYLLDDSCVFGVEVFVTKEMCSGKGECLSMIDAVAFRRHPENKLVFFSGIPCVSSPKTPDCAMQPRGSEFTLRIKDQQQSRHIAGKVRHWFSESSQESGWGNFVSLAYFHHTTSGCLVNDMCMVEAEVTVHAVANTMFDTRSQIVETNRLVRESRCK